MNKNYPSAYEPEDFMPIVDKAVDVTWTKAKSTNSSLNIATDALLT